MVYRSDREARQCERLGQPFHVSAGGAGAVGQQHETGGAVHRPDNRIPHVEANRLLMRLLVGDSAAGISAGLHARELNPAAAVILLGADRYPNFSICGIPYHVSGEGPDWRNRPYRTAADLHTAGVHVLLEHRCLSHAEGRMMIPPDKAGPARRRCDHVCAAGRGRSLSVQARPVRNSRPAMTRPASMSRTNIRSLIRPTIFLPVQAPARVAGVSAAP